MHHVPTNERVISRRHGDRVVKTLSLPGNHDKVAGDWVLEITTATLTRDLTVKPMPYEKWEIYLPNGPFHGGNQSTVLAGA